MAAGPELHPRTGGTAGFTGVFGPCHPCSWPAPRPAGGIALINAVGISGVCRTRP